MSSSSKFHSQRVIGIIPARLASTRLPRKVLREIAGKPMLAWVVEAAMASAVFNRVVVATDSDEVAAECRVREWEFCMTSSELQSGTDRVHATVEQLVVGGFGIGDEDVVVNIQGDEPLLRPAHFHALLRPFARSEVEVSTVMTPCPQEGVASPNVVKVTVDRNGKALYFSRAPIPWDRDGRGTDGQNGVAYWKHLGLYGYRKRALDRFATLPPSQLELAERLEQLRLLENGISIYVEPVEFDTVGVDTEEDLSAAAAVLAQRKGFAAG